MLLYIPRIEHVISISNLWVQRKLGMKTGFWLKLALKHWPNLRLGLNMAMGLSLGLKLALKLCLQLKIGLKMGLNTMG